MTAHAAFIGIGSNLGDKIGRCRKGIEALAGLSVDGRIETSRFYKTSPVDCEDQDWFVNAVARIHTGLTPDELLRELKQIERRSGRMVQSRRFGPRELDMDILLYNDLVQVGEGLLIIPHPRMHKRRFVLKPLCDIAPDRMHPVIRQTMIRLLEQLPEDQQIVEELSACFV